MDLTEISLDSKPPPYTVNQQDQAINRLNKATKTLNVMLVAVLFLLVFILVAELFIIGAAVTGYKSLTWRTVQNYIYGNDGNLGSTE